MKTQDTQSTGNQDATMRITFPKGVINGLKSWMDATDWSGTGEPITNSHVEAFMINAVEYAMNNCKGLDDYIKMADKKAEDQAAEDNKKAIKAAQGEEYRRREFMGISVHQCTDRLKGSIPQVLDAFIRYYSNKKQNDKHSIAHALHMIDREKYWVHAKNPEMYLRRDLLDLLINEVNLSSKSLFQCIRSDYTVDRLNEIMAKIK